MIPFLIVPVAKMMLIAAAAGGIGGEALRLLRYRAERPGEAGIVAVSIGLALYSLSFFAIGFLGGWTALGAWLLLVPGLVAFAARLRLAEVEAVGRTWAEAFRRLPAWGKGGGLLLVLLLIVQFLATLAPPSSPDALAYHLALPKIYADAHRWVYLPDSFFADNPSGVEMLFLACRLIGAEAAAPLVHWLFGALLAAAIVCFARERFPEQAPVAAVVAALLVVSMPLYAFEATSAFIDLATALYTLLAVWLGLKALTRSRPDAAWAAGLCAGAAAASKISGIGVWPALAAMALATTAYGATPPGTTPPGTTPPGTTPPGTTPPAGLGGARRWRVVSALIIGALALSLPWFVKAWAFTGNPVWPLFYNRLGGRYWNPDLARAFAAGMSARYGFGHGAAQLLRLPWDLTRHAARFDDGPMGMSLFILPCLALPASIRRSNAPLWAALGVYLLTWFFVLSQQARFLLPLLPVWAALAVDGMDRIAGRLGGADSAPSVGRRDFRPARPVLRPVLGPARPVFRPARAALWGGLAGATILLGAAGSLWYCAREIPVVFGRESRDAYLARTYPFYRDAQHLNSTLPAGTKVLVTDRRGYYLNRSYEHDGLDQDVIDYGKLRSPDDLLRRLRQLGITHVWYESLSPPGAEKAPPRPDANGILPKNLYERYEILHQGLRARMRLVYHRRRPVSLRRSSRVPDAVAESEVYAVAPE